MDFLRNNNQGLMQLGLGLLSGRTGQEQAAMGAQGLAGALNQNKTVQWLQKTNPDLAAAVQQGAISPGDAWKMAYTQKLEAQKPKSPLEVNGRLVDPDTYQVLADFSEKKRNLGFHKLDDGTYGSWDESTGQFTPLGKAAKVGGMDDYSNRANAAASLGMSQDDPRYQPFVLTGKMPREDTQALTATDKKALWSAEDEIPLIDNTLSSLQRARDLNRKTFTGMTAGARGVLGTAVPGGSYLVDGEAAKATAEFNKLMSMEAIQSMAQTLKGATTDSELARFVDILADPSTDPDIRERTIDRMMSLAQRVKDVKANRVNELRGNDGAIGNAAAPSAGGVPVRRRYNPQTGMLE